MRWILLVVALVALGTGCAAPEQGAPTAQPPSSAPDEPSEQPSDEETDPPLSSTDLPTMTPPTGPPKTPTDQISPITVAGTVEQGVEAGCVVLTAADTHVTYVLTGPLSEQVDLGTMVKVRGMPQRDLVSTCQQGIMLRVHEVLPT